MIAENYPDSDVFVVNTGTKNNMPFFINVLSHFKINQHVIHDSDERYLYDKDGKPKRNQDGDSTANSAWTLNKTIWEHILSARQSGVKINRYVSIRNFEDSHNYKYDSKKGKPFSAYEYSKTLDINDDSKSIVNFLY